MKNGKRIVLFTLFAMNLVDQPTPPIVIEQGTLTGIVNAEGTIFEYVGIPYGVANSTNRFRAPYPPPKWDGVFKATEETSCAQPFPILGTVGLEDCLKINIYVPVKARKPLPVMVFIHGGGFKLGSGGKLVYSSEFLVKHDVILVTFNYRLGILGFLCLGIQEAPGNAGIKDQIAALRWVKQNIAAFGGDPDNITIFGESAGGTSVSLLLAIKATNGLFNKAIVQSGSSIANWSVNRNPIWVASLVAKELGYGTEDPHKLYEIFSNIPYADLIGVKAKKPIGKYFDTQLLHLPCVEMPLPEVEIAVDDLPYDLLRNNPKNIPVIYGSNTLEGLFLVLEESEETLIERNEKYIFASDLQFPSEKEAADLNEKIKKFYFGDTKISIAVKDNLTDLYTQLYFEIPELLESDIILEHSKAAVYNYIFNYSGGRNLMKNRIGLHDETGACHADELLYLFNAHIWPFPINEKDQQVIDWMTTIWTNFAKYGDPTPSSLPIKWERSTPGHLKFLYFEDHLRMGPMPNPEGYQIWKDVYQKYRRKDLKYYLPLNGSWNTAAGWEFHSLQFALLRRKQIAFCEMVVCRLHRDGNQLFALYSEGGTGLQELNRVISGHTLRNVTGKKWLGKQFCDGAQDFVTEYFAEPSQRWQHIKGDTPYTNAVTSESYVQRLVWGRTTVRRCVAATQRTGSARVASLVEFENYLPNCRIKRSAEVFPGQYRWSRRHARELFI